MRCAHNNNYLMAHTCEESQLNAMRNCHASNSIYEMRNTARNAEKMKLA